VPKNRRVVAALAPQMLKAVGAPQRRCTPVSDHARTHATARELMGPEAFLAPEHKVVLTTDAEKARAVGRKALEILPQPDELPEQLQADGFTDEDLARPGSDRFVDAVVAYGTTDAIAARLKEHLTAGADHVPVQVLTSPDKLVPALAELAGPLGLQ